MSCFPSSLRPFIHKSVSLFTSRKVPSFSSFPSITLISFVAFLTLSAHLLLGHRKNGLRGEEANIECVSVHVGPLLFVYFKFS